MTGALGPVALALAAALAVTLLLFCVMWLISLRTRDVGAVDIVWGPGFALIAWLEWLWLRPGAVASTVLLLAVTLWAARLAAHLFVRHRLSDREDARYAAMRAADPAFARTSLVKVFGLQAVILWALALPIHLAMALGASGGFGVLGWIGLGLFAVGFALETVADAQLLAFRRDPARRGGLLTTGPFAWSRHPNYFGESLLWFGLGCLAWEASGQIWALLGPVALTALLLKVSGIPLLEAHLAATRPGFAAYKARTSAFIPWPPGRV
jgi:steroid 5-alpha reductase family enzyme